MLSIGCITDDIEFVNTTLFTISSFHKEEEVSNWQSEFHPVNPHLIATGTDLSHCYLFVFGLAIFSTHIFTTPVLSVFVITFACTC